MRDFIDGDGAAARPEPGRRARPAAEDDFAVDATPDARHPIVSRTASDPDGGARIIERLVREHRYPLIEPGVATFLWRGAADSLWLRHFMPLGAGSFPFERISDDLWHLRLKVPDGSRFEYKLDVVRGGHGVWINDPLNPRLATDPFGANSVCHTWGYAPPPWIERGSPGPEGRLKRIAIRSAAFGDRREIGVRLPAGYYEGRACPLLVVHDGFDYLDHAALGPILDGMIHRGEIPPLMTVLIQSPDRAREYVDDPRHASFIANEVLPALEARFGIAPETHQRVLMGASLGAVASLSIAARVPKLFGAVVLKSGSFIFNRSLLDERGELFERVSTFVEGLTSDQRILRRAFVSCGRFEALCSENRRMAAFLRRTGVKTRFVESRDAHHWQNWRDQTRAGLMWCFPPHRG